MKKSIILSIIACCAAFTSCNMDEMPSTSIPTDESILTVKTVKPLVICFMLNGEDTSKMLIQWMRWYNPDY